MRKLQIAMFAVIAAAPTLGAIVRAQNAVLPPEDYQAAINEANQQLAGMSQRAEALSVTISQQAREIVKLKAEVDKLTPKPPTSTPTPTP